MILRTGVLEIQSLTNPFNSEVPQILQEPTEPVCSVIKIVHLFIQLSHIYNAVNTTVA